VTAVSVVIPTTLRPELRRALLSVRAQEGPETEVIVVVDAPSRRAPTRIEGNPLDLADILLFTGGNRGGSHARNLGVRNATGRWIAYLDDDDEWTAPTKLARQVDTARIATARGAHHVVVSCQARQRWAGRMQLSAPIPQPVYSGTMTVAEFLFRRRGPRVTRASIWPSTILTDAELARIVRWDEELSRHQDWDWLVRADRVEGTAVIQLAEPLVTVALGSSGSISSGADWETSLRWADKLRDHADDATFADFVAGQTLRYALQARSAEGIRASARVLVTVHRPSLPSLLLGLSGVLSRRSLERLMWWRFRRG
jgi:glycosyltransferase involved in cell wall biosynthesis